MTLKNELGETGQGQSGCRAGMPGGGWATPKSGGVVEGRDWGDSLEIIGCDSVVLYCSLFSFEGRTIQGSVLLEGLEGLMEEDPGGGCLAVVGMAGGPVQDFPYRQGLFGDGRRSGEERKWPDSNPRYHVCTV